MKWQGQAMRQQRWRAWPWGGACVCKCQGHKPSFIKAWGHHSDLYCLCNSFGQRGVRIICTKGASRAGKRPQVSVSCENLLAVKSTYTLWNPLTCLHCFITRSVVWGELSLNDTVELPLLVVQKLSFASETYLSFSFLLALPWKPPAAVCRHLLPSCTYLCLICVWSSPSPGIRGVPFCSLSERSWYERGCPNVPFGTDAGFKSLSICGKSGGNLFCGSSTTVNW